MEFRQPAFRIPYSAIIINLLLIGLFASANAEGGTISITSRVTMSVTGERLKGSLMVTNLGTAPAHRMRAEITFPWGAQRALAKTTLGTGDSVTFPLEETIENLKRGTHPVAILIRFQDEKGYPFTAISCTTFSYREATEGELRCLGEPLSMTAKGTVRFRLENPGSRAVAVTATLLVPREFSAARKSMDLLIRGGSTETLSVPLTNLSALNGAAYPVYIVIEYDLDDSHYTAVSHVLVKISEGRNWFRQTRWYWAGGMAVLLGAIGLWRVFSSKKR